MSGTAPVFAQEWNGGAISKKQFRCLARAVLIYVSFQSAVPFPLAGEGQGEEVAVNIRSQHVFFNPLSLEAYLYPHLSHLAGGTFESREKHEQRWPSTERRPCFSRDRPSKKCFVSPYLA